MALQAKTFNDLITFGRTTGGGRWNSAGQYEWLAANQPRFDYDPLSKLIKGLLIEEPRTNLLTFSSRIDDSSWVKTASTVQPSPDIDPMGTLNAWALRPNAGTGVVGRVYKSFPATAGVTYTFSIFAKKKEISFLRLLSTGGTSTVVESYFDLTSMLTGNNTGLTSRIVDVGGGWARCIITFTANTTATCLVYAQAATSLFVHSYTGDGTPAILVAMSQLEVGGFDTSYVPSIDSFTSRASTATYVDAAGATQTAAINVARSNAYGYDSAGVLRPIGLLVEAAATNLYTYSQAFTDASWSKTAGSAPAGGPVAPMGLTHKYIADANVTPHFLQKTFTGVLGTRYTSWRVLKAGEHSLIRMQLYATPLFGQADFDLAAGTVSGNSNGQASIKPLGGGWFLCAMTGVCTVDGQVSDRWYPVVGGVTSFAGNGTDGYYICAGQLETEYASSYIPTTSAQVTRAADIASSVQVTRAADMPLVNVLSPWYNPLEGTLFIDASTSSQGAVGSELSTGVNTNRMTCHYRTVGGIAVAVVVSASANTFGTAVASGKMALGYKDNDFAVSIGGVAPSKTALSKVPVVNQLKLGYRSGGIPDYLNGHIRSIKYFPRRLSDAELQAVTV